MNTGPPFTPESALGEVSRNNKVKGNMKKVNALILPVGEVWAKVELDEDASSVTEPTQRLKKTHWCMAFVSQAGHALSQYYHWLQRTDKPW